MEFQRVEKPDAIIYQFPMSRLAISATDEAGAVPVPEGDVPREPPKDFLKDARRKLAENPAIAAQWAPYEIERLDFEVSRLRREVADLRQKNEELSGRFSDERVELERLRGAGAISKRNEILSTLLIAAASAGVAVAAIYWSTPVVETFARAVFAISLVAIVAGIILRKWG